MAYNFPTTTIANLPAASANAGKVYNITDGVSETDRTIGNGGISLFVKSNGVSWYPVKFERDIIDHVHPVSDIAGLTGYLDDPQLLSLSSLSFTGNASKFIRVNAGETAFELATVSGSGDVVGPASSTDNAVARFDGTGGKTLQNSGVLIDDSNNLTIPGTITAGSGPTTITNSTGKLLDGALSSNVPLLNASNTFSALQVISVSTNAGAGFASGLEVTIQGIGTLSGSYAGLSVTGLYTGSGAANTVYGVSGAATISNAAGGTSIFGSSGDADNASSGTVGEVAGAIGKITNSGGGTITTASAVKGIATVTNGTVATLRGIDLSGWSSSGTVTTSYGIYMNSSIDVGATRYALYSLSTSPSLLTGNLRAPKLGLGIDVPSSNTLYVNATSTSTSASERATYSILTSNPAANSTARLFGLRAESNTQIGGNNVNYGTVGALDVDVAFNSTGTATALESYSGTTYNASGSTITTLDGVKQWLQSDTGTVTKSRGFFYGYQIGGGTTTDAYGFYVSNPTGAGSITNNYGIYIENMVKGGTLNYSIYAAGGLAHFGGILEAGSGPTTLTNSTGKVLISALNTTGTPDGTKFLRDDGQWTTVVGGGGSPGGSGSEIQYRVNASTFGAVTSSSVSGAQVTWADKQIIALDNATTNVADPLLDIQHSSSGTVAAEFGSRIRFGLESSTTVNRDVAAIDGSWEVATDASRKGQIRLWAADATQLRNVVTIRTAGAGNRGTLYLGNPDSPDFLTHSISAENNNLTIRSPNSAYDFVDSIGGVGFQLTAAHTSGVDSDQTWVLNPAGTQQSRFRVLVSDNSGTTNVYPQVRITRNNAATPGTGFGTSLNFLLESSTTESQDAAQVATLWTDATHASRTAALVVSTVNNATAIAERGRFTATGLTLGVAGTMLGQLTLSGNTSGTTILQPAATASGTLTLPAATDTLVGRATTDTLTNKRITSRVTEVTNTATSVTIDVSTTDIHITTAQAGALLYNNPTGSPTSGQKLMIRIKDNGTARALTYDTQFRASSDLALPSTTIISKTLYMGFIWNSTDSKWDLLAVMNNFT